MNIKKTFIVSLMATAAGGWLQAETLTFSFASPSGSVTFGSSGAGTNVGTAFSGSLDLQSVTSPGASATCNACTFNFTTGALTSFTTVSVPGTNFYVYDFASNSGSTAVSAVTGPTGSLNTPNPPGGGGSTVGGSSTLLAGSLGASTIGGYEPNPPTGATSLGFSAPVSAGSSGNLLSTILTAFGFGSTTFPVSGTLSFNVSFSGPAASNGYFTGSVTGGELTLNVSATPEPSSVLLIGLGLLGVAFIGRKRMLAHRL